MTTSSAPSEAVVFEQVCQIVWRVLDVEPGDIDLARDMVLTDDVGLESIDLVAIGAMLADRFGPQVNLAAYLAELSIDDVIVLRLADLVTMVVSSWATPELSGR